MPVEGLKLGRKPVKRPAGLLSLRTLMPHLPAVPAEVHWGRDIRDWGMMLNNQLGCCTIASVGHAIMTMTDAAHPGHPVVMTDAEVLKGYEQACGYVPGDASTDQGGHLSDILAHWQSVGFDAAGRVDQVSGWVSIDIDDIEAIRFAIARLGVVSAGILMTQTAMQEFQEGLPWETPTSDVEGGHAVPLIGYAPTAWEAVTWSQRQAMSIKWWLGMAEEVYALLDEDLAGANGMDWAVIQKSMQAVQESVQPVVNPPPS